MILGDHNARIGEHVIPGVKERFNEKSVNENGNRHINKIFYDHKPQHKYTFMNTRGQKSTIDYISIQMTSYYFKSPRRYGGGKHISKICTAAPTAHACMHAEINVTQYPEKTINEVVTNVSKLKRSKEYVKVCYADDVVL